MKKNLLILLAAACALPVMADLQGSGYYRVQNYATNRYVEVVDNKGSIDYGATSAELHAIQLQKNFDLVCSDPASVLYIKNHDQDQYLIEAQGTSVYSIIGHNLRLAANGTAPNGQTLYRAYGSYQGVTRYLGDGNALDGDIGSMSTTATGNYAKWYILPITPESDNYFGAALPVKAGAKYYATMMTAFPYTPNSSSTKTYVINRIDNGMAEMVEVTGVIPGATPVIIEGTSALPTDNRMKLGGNGTNPANNSLKGVYFDYNEAKYQNYVSYNPKTMRVLGLCSDGSLGFITADIKTIPANTAYITVAEGSPSEFKCVSTEEFESYTPPVPTYPQALYAVGNFNDWTTPDAANAGYLTIPMTGEGQYSATITYGESGLLAFKVFDSLTSDWKHAYGAVNGGEIALEAGNPYTWEVLLGDGAADFEVSNWGGGSGTITVDLTTNTLSIVTSTILSFPETVYLAGNFNDWKAADQNYAFTTTGEGIYKASFELPFMGEDPLLFKVTADADWAVNYGANADKDYMMEVYKDYSVNSSVKSKGANWGISNWLEGKLTLTLDLNKQTLTIEAPDQPAAPLFGDKIYLVGDMNGWDINSTPYELTPTSTYIYSATFDLEPATYYFRFYTELGDFGSNSIGSSENPDTNIVVTFNSNDTFNSSYTFGQGTWSLQNWAGGPISFTLNTQGRMVSIYAEGADVKTIDVENGPTVVYNLMGVKVLETSDRDDLNNLPKGLYIINGKKTLLR